MDRRGLPSEFRRERDRRESSNKGARDQALMLHYLAQDMIERHDGAKAEGRICTGLLLGDLPWHLSLGRSKRSSRSTASLRSSR
jgi:hypothetical protein